MISLNRFSFRGNFSTDFDLIAGMSFDDDNGATETFLNKEAVSSTVYDGTKHNVHGYKYTDVLTPKLTLVKKNRGEFSDFENRKILAWLTGSSQVEKMVCYRDDSDVISFVLIGNITQIEQRKISNSRIIGYEFTFEHIAPWAYSPTRTITKDITLPEQIPIDCYTDVYEKNIYPKIQVTIGDSLYLEVAENPMVDTYIMLDNTVYKYGNNYYVKINGQKQTISGIFATDIENQTPDDSTYNKYYLCNTDLYIYKGIINEDSTYAWQRLIKIGAGFEIKNTYYKDGKDISITSTVTDCHKNEVITLDGTNRVISSSETPMRIFGDSFNWDWIYLVPGENNITVSGGCKVTIQWVEPIKIGNV